MMPAPATGSCDTPNMSPAEIIIISIERAKINGAEKQLRLSIYPKFKTTNVASRVNIMPIQYFVSRSSFPDILPT